MSECYRNSVLSVLLLFCSNPLDLSSLCTTMLLQDSKTCNIKNNTEEAFILHMIHLLDSTGVGVGSKVNLQFVP